MFTKKEACLLRRMRIDPGDYYRYLHSKFNKNASIFCKLLDYFDSPKKVGNNKNFLKFSKTNNIDCDSEIGNYAYELYNNLIRFYCGGVYNLFKLRQPEWGAPKVSIRREDVPTLNNIGQLSDPQIIYRGLSDAEHNSKNYGQSWTLDIGIAKKFSNDTYSDQPTGVVVKAKVSRKNILYFEKNDSEKEVIIENGSITTAKNITNCCMRTP